MGSTDNKAKVGGILSIISGAFGVLWLGWMLFWVYMMGFIFREPFYPYGGMPSPPDEALNMLMNMMMIMYSAIGLFFALIGVLGIIGGIFALKRRRWGLALTGAIAGTLTFFPCGIPAIIFVSMAQPEFSTSQPSPPAD